MVKITLLSLNLFIFLNFAPLKVQAKAKSYQIIAKLSTACPTQYARWSTDGMRFVYHEEKKDKSTIKVFYFTSKKIISYGSHKHNFFPVFGPLKTIIAGPKQDLPWLALPPKKPQTKPKSKQKKIQKLKVKKKLHPSLRKKLLPRKNKNKMISLRPSQQKHLQPKFKPQKSKAVTKWGISMIDKTQRSYLFPGVMPSYSKNARRLLFTYRDVLYLWDPLKSRKRGLMLLTRGSEARWSHDGRAISFTRQPQKASKGKKSSGLFLVDMLFRAAKLNHSGQESTWSADNQHLLFVQRKSGRNYLRQIDLRKKPAKAKKLGIETEGNHPHFMPKAKPHGKYIFAFQNSQGVWLMNVVTQKKLLLLPKASFPRWSSRGHLLVHTSRHILVLKISLQTIKKIS